MTATKFMGKILLSMNNEKNQIRTDMTPEEKEDLVGKVTELEAQDVRTAEDYVQILDICRRACARRIAEIDEDLKPDGPVQ